MIVTVRIGRDDGSIPEHGEHGDTKFRPMTELSQAETVSKQNTDRRQQVGRLLRLATYASVSVAMTLIVAKLFAWLATDSVAMLGSLMDSVLDAGASLINLFAVRHALMPADREHRFGHGKAEALAGLAQAAFIAGSAAFLILQALDRLYRPREIEASEIGIAVLVGSIVLTLALVLFQRYVVRQTGSVAIKGDSLHYRGDLLMNLAVILALILSSQFGLIYLDPIFAVVIAGYILFGAWRIFQQANDHLMDRELPEDERQKIRDIAMAHSQVLSLHDLRTRSSGVHTFIQLHLELEPEISLIEAHEISDEVEALIRNEFQEAEVIIHQDPYGVEEERANFSG